jgi:hypothetical protein
MAELRATHCSYCHSASIKYGGRPSWRGARNETTSHLYAHTYARARTHAYTHTRTHTRRTCVDNQPTAATKGAVGCALWSCWHRTRRSPLDETQLIKPDKDDSFVGEWLITNGPLSRVVPRAVGWFQGCFEGHGRSLAWVFSGFKAFHLAYVI